MCSGKIIGQCGSRVVIDCEICGLSHLDPLPLNPVEIYSTLFYSKIKPNYLKDQLKYKDWWSKMAMVELSALDAHRKVSEKKLLDVGSGYGLFADVARTAGFEVTELEPAEQPRELRSRNHRVIAEPIEHADLGVGKFTVIRMAWVLEHLRDPAAALRKCYDALVPGGLISITVPNDFNPLQEMVRSKTGDYWIDPTHCFYFSKESLLHLLSRCKFQFAAVSTSYPMEQFLLMGHDYTRSKEVGDMVHEWRVNLESSLLSSSDGCELFLTQRVQWAQQGIGRDLTMIARKPDGTISSLLRSYEKN